MKILSFLLLHAGWKQYTRGPQLVLSDQAVFSDSCADSRGAIEKKLASGRCPKDLWYVTLRTGPEEGFFDVFNGRYRGDLPERDRPYLIVGAARSRSEAAQLVAAILAALYGDDAAALPYSEAKRRLREAFSNLPDGENTAGTGPEDNTP